MRRTAGVRRAAGGAAIVALAIVAAACGEGGRASGTPTGRAATTPSHTAGPPTATAVTAPATATPPAAASPGVSPTQGQTPAAPAATPTREGAAPATVPPAAPATATPRGPGAQALVIIAKGVAFVPNALTVSVGGVVTITFENQDADVAHDIVFFDPAGARIAGTEVATGPITQRTSFTAAAAGRYAFKCTVHPQQMYGAITVQ